MTVSDLLTKEREDEGTEIRPWNELTVAALILVHMSWIVPWFVLFAGRDLAQSEGKVFLVLCLLEASLYLVVRLGVFLRLKVQIRQGIFLAGLGLGWLVSWLVLGKVSANGASLQVSGVGGFLSDLGNQLPLQVLLTVVVLFLGKLAMDMAREWNGPVSVFNSMRLAVIMLSLFGLILGQAAGAITIYSVYLFLGASLVALVAARMASFERKQVGRQGTFDRRWLLAVTGLAVILVGLATVVSQLATGRANLLAAALRNLFTAFITLISLPFLLLIALLQPLFDVMQKTQKQSQPAEPTEPSYQFTQTPFASETGPTNSHLWMLVGQILFWIVVLFVLFLLLRRLANWYASQIRSMQDERQSLLDAAGLWKKLLASLRGQFRKAADSIAGLPRFGRRERLRAATRVRQIYVDLMDLSADLGAPRRASVTPSEFLPVIQKVFQETSQDLVTITQAYQRVRYGILPETIQEVQEVETAWFRVKTYGEQLLKQNSSLA